MTEDEREWIEERAAILEFDAGFSRQEAEKMARKMWSESKRLDVSPESD